MVGQQKGVIDLLVVKLEKLSGCNGFRLRAESRKLLINN